MDHQNLLIIFTRYPVPGKTKTRLIPRIGEKGAARLQRDMTLHMVRTACELLPYIETELLCEGDSEDEIREVFGSDLPVRFQSDGDLGDRMLCAFSNACERDFKRVVLVGSDCPFITSDILMQAFQHLGNTDCVLGPSYDGGYYLMGLNKPCPEVFKGIAWGSSDVLDQTLEKAASAGLTASLLEKLHDIDRPEDVLLWEAFYKNKYVSISAIIPVLNEGAVIVNALKPLRKPPGIELIVVDGGSSDGTPELAASCGATVVASPPGRSVQMNIGAKYACSEILLFLHADTRLPDGFDRHIISALADPCTIAGSFSLRFDDESLPMRIVAWGANVRSRVLSLPYGDQALFLKSVDYRTSGGFPDLPLLEDAVFIQSLRSKGKVVTLPMKVTTSARRYQRLGMFRTWLINQCVLIGFHLGVDPAELARLYRTHGGIREWLILMKSFAGRKPRAER